MESFTSVFGWDGYTEASSGWYWRLRSVILFVANSEAALLVYWAMIKSFLPFMVHDLLGNGSEGVLGGNTVHGEKIMDIEVFSEQRLF